MTRDILSIVGLLSLSAGCSWAWPPLGPIVFGVVLLGGAVLGHLRDGAAAPQKDESSDATAE